MKRLMVVMMAAASLGVFADQVADAKASDPKNQVAAPEGNGVGMRTGATQRWPRANRSAIVRVETSKVDAFLKTHFGVKFGALEDGFTNVVQLIGGEARSLPVLKEVGCLKSAIGRFRNGKLLEVHFVADGVCEEHTSPLPENLQKSYVCVAKELGIDPSAVKPLGLVFGDAGYLLQWNAPLWDKDCKGIYNVQIKGLVDNAVRTPSRRSRTSVLGRRSLVSAGVEPPKEVYEKIPEEYQSILRSKINDLAGKQATSEASDKFGVLFTPRSWTNGFDKGMIVSIQGDRYRSSLFLKCDLDGKILQLGELSAFEEFKWRNARRGEIVTNLWNDQQLVDGLLATEISNDTQRRRRSRNRALMDSRMRPVDEVSDFLKQSRLGLLQSSCCFEGALAADWELNLPEVLSDALRSIDLGAIQTNVDAFLMKHFSVRFGDSITNFPRIVVGGMIDYLRDVPVTDKFKHLNRAIGRFAAGKLYEIYFLVDVPKKYSKASAETRVDQDIIEMVGQLGVPIEVFKRSMSFLHPRSPYTLKKLQVDDLSERPYEGYGKPDGVYRFGVVISARELHNKFAVEEVEKAREDKTREENKGEEFPDAE